MRFLVLGLAAATLGFLLAPPDALAHRRVTLHHGLKVCSERDHRGWNAFSRNPGLPGYPGPHYGCDCYRAASGRAMCLVI